MSSLNLPFFGTTQAHGTAPAGPSASNAASSSATANIQLPSFGAAPAGPSARRVASSVAPAPIRLPSFGAAPASSSASAAASSSAVSAVQSPPQIIEESSLQFDENDGYNDLRRLVTENRRRQMPVSFFSLSDRYEPMVNPDIFWNADKVHVPLSDSARLWIEQNREHIVVPTELECPTVYDIIHETYPVAVPLRDIPSVLYAAREMYTKTRGRIVLKQAPNSTTYIVSIESPIPNAVQIYMYDALFNLRSHTDSILQYLAHRMYPDTKRTKSKREQSVYKSYESAIDRAQNKLASAPLWYEVSPPDYITEMSVTQKVSRNDELVYIRNIVTEKVNLQLLQYLDNLRQIFLVTEVSAYYHYKRKFAVPQITIPGRYVSTPIGHLGQIDWRETVRNMHTAIGNIEELAANLTDDVTLNRMLRATFASMSPSDQCVAIDIMRSLFIKMYVPFLEKVAEKLQAVLNRFATLPANFQSTNDEDVWKTFLLGPFALFTIFYESRYYESYGHMSAQHYAILVNMKLTRRNKVFTTSLSDSSDSDSSSDTDSSSDDASSGGGNPEVQMLYVLNVFPYFGVISGVCDVMLRRLAIAETLSLTERDLLVQYQTEAFEYQRAMHNELDYPMDTFMPGVDPSVYEELPSATSRLSREQAKRRATAPQKRND